MLHPRPDIQSEAKVRDIELGKDQVYEGLLGAIAFVTKKELESLHTEHAGEKLQDIMRQVRQIEEGLLQIFREYLRSDIAVETIEIRLTEKGKDAIERALPGIFFLYKHRMGDTKVRELERIIDRDDTANYTLCIEYGKRGENSIFYIRRIYLKDR